MVKIKIDGIEINVIDIDRNLQINDISGENLRRIWERLKTEYADYEKWICYHNYPDIPYDLLDELGFGIEDDSVAMRLYADKHNLCEVNNVIRVDGESYEEFAVFHDRRNSDMYWTGERVKRDLSRWGIFIIRDENGICGYTFLTMRNPEESEIFCVEASDIEKCRDLIACAAKYAFDNGKKEVLYMADEGTDAHKAAISLGFANTGFYKGYMVR
jgi:hypothetical protein